GQGGRSPGARAARSRFALQRAVALQAGARRVLPGAHAGGLIAGPRSQLAYFEWIAESDPSTPTEATVLRHIASRRDKLSAADVRTHSAAARAPWLGRARPRRCRAGRGVRDGGAGSALAAPRPAAVAPGGALGHRADPGANVRRR